MSVTIVVGGQYGSEGKGKVAALLASAAAAPWLVRCGGPNAGHTVTLGGQPVVLRQLPCCLEPFRAMFCVAAGCAVDTELLLSEVERLKLPGQNVVVDPRAVLIEPGDCVAEREFLTHISSTCSGTGAALARRMSRHKVRLVKDSPDIDQRCRVESVAPLIQRAARRGETVIVEGTQGFGLSLLHGTDYPYLTARDTTAAAFASEAGLSPRHVDRIILVVRTFPIRVAGPSGPFNEEISWEAVCELSHAPKVVPEYTSVTKRLRRVAHFDLELVRRACDYNQPTSLAVMGLDRLDYANTNVTERRKLTAPACAFLDRLEAETKVPVQFIGTGPGTWDIVDGWRSPLKSL